MTCLSILLAAMLIMSASLTAQDYFVIDSLKKEAYNAPPDLKAEYYNKICWALRNSNPAQAIVYGKQAVSLANQHNDFNELARAYSYLGVAYRNAGDFEQALVHYRLGMETATKNNILVQQGYAHNNFANWYIYSGENELALTHLQKADSIARLLEDAVMTAYIKLNKGRAYTALQQYDSAYENLSEALGIRTQMRDESGQSVCYKYIADLQHQKGQPSEAAASYKKALQLAGNMLDEDLLSDIYNKKAAIFFEQKQTNEAKKFAEKSLTEALKTNNPVRIRAAYIILSEIAFSNQNNTDAFRYSKLARLYTDSMYLRQLNEKVTNIEYLVNLEKSESLIAELEKDAVLQKAQLQSQRARLGILILVVALILVLLVSIYINNRQKKKAYRAELQKNKIITQQNKDLHQSNEEVKTQRDEIEHQKAAIERQQIMITDSIQYAERIQNAALPKKEMIDKLFPYNFVLYIPRDIVSGDFYFFKKIGKYIIVSAADCTGHGVPGAFVSMLGISLLNEITENKKIVSPEIILRELRKNIKYSLQQSIDNDSQDDGMDMSLAVINTETLEMEFAGANNAGYLLRNGELVEFSPNLNPVGIYFREKPFTKQTYQLKENDTIYLFSDGYSDQFGGEKNRRFMTSNLKQSLISLQKYPMTIQRNLLKQHFHTWKGNNSQLDDVVIVGIKIKNLLNKEQE